MNDKKVEFFPFHAINQFMVSEYRLNVLRVVFQRMDELSGERRSAVNRVVKSHLQVPGFRNSSLAPLSIKVKNAAAAFEKTPDFTAQILQSWSELHPDLRSRVYDVLKQRGWELLPAETDRTKIPGFLTDWVKGENYDVLDKAFAEQNPDFTASTDDIRLMMVWVSGRLPVGMDEEEEEEQEQEKE